MCIKPKDIGFVGLKPCGYINRLSDGTFRHFSRNFDTDIVGLLNDMEHERLEMEKRHAKKIKETITGFLKECDGEQYKFDKLHYCGHFYDDGGSEECSSLYLNKGKIMVGRGNTFEKDSNYDRHFDKMSYICKVKILDLLRQVLLSFA